MAGVWPFRPRARAEARARLERAEGPVIYAIGDIHGCLRELRELEGLIADDPAPEGKLLVYLGDYVDRGPESAGVIEHLLAPPPFPAERVFLTGNHEAMWLDFLAEPRPDSVWLANGGVETLRSYGLANFRGGTAALAEAIPDTHRAFLAGLAASLVVGECIFVHAGLRPGVPLARQSDDDMMWIRNDFLESPVELDKWVIHGHTPAKEPYVDHRRIGIDTAAFATGRLTAVRLDRQGYRFIATRGN
jgi:serine/threonine protein phosphatase 1